MDCKTLGFSLLGLAAIIDKAHQAACLPFHKEASAKLSTPNKSQPEMACDPYQPCALSKVPKGRSVPLALPNLQFRVSDPWTTKGEGCGGSALGCVSNT